MLSVGDLVWWAPKYGRPPEPVAIKSIDLCDRPGEKYGIPVGAIHEADLSRSCMSLENGHWKYGNELVPLTQDEVTELKRRAA